MDKFVITGGKTLEGDVTISGAKNAALPILASTILAQGEHVITNVPEVKDVNTMRKLLSYMGVANTDGSQLHVCFDKIDKPEAPYELVKTMRASSLILGPLVARTGYASVSLPGGCTIGARPLNMHLDALKAMSVEIHLEHGYIEAKTSRLKGANICFDTVTVTGTENIMMAATLAQGKTIIENAAKEPEVSDLAQYLKKMGAKIEGEGTNRITIDGVEKLHASTYAIIPDRIETGTFMIAASITGSSVNINHGSPQYLNSLIDKLRATGVNIEVLNSDIRIRAPKQIKATDITTLPHPGFATDLQAQFMALMSIAEGSSIITENIFENRFQHVAELNRMGADITVEGATAFVRGVDKLVGAQVMATDLRASASLIIAALVAEGTTEINRIYHIDRGYENIEQKLTALGASIVRTPTDPTA
jgi:UDP-N-acetylglucosamine 1-carboxyvinyltransferase